MENPTYLGLAGACVLALIIALVKGSNKQVIEKKETTTDKSTSSSSSSAPKSKKIN